MAQGHWARPRAARPRAACLRGRFQEVSLGRPALEQWSDMEASTRKRQLNCMNYKSTIEATTGVPPLCMLHHELKNVLLIELCFIYLAAFLQFINAHTHTYIYMTE